VASFFLGHGVYRLHCIMSAYTRYIQPFLMVSVRVAALGTTNIHLVELSLEDTFAKSYHFINFCPFVQKPCNKTKGVLWFSAVPREWLAYNQKRMWIKALTGATI